MVEDFHPRNVVPRSMLLSLLAPLVMWQLRDTFTASIGLLCASTLPETRHMTEDKQGPGGVVVSGESRRQFRKCSNRGNA